MRLFELALKCGLCRLGVGLLGRCLSNLGLKCLLSRNTGRFRRFDLRRIVGGHLPDLRCI